MDWSDSLWTNLGIIFFITGHLIAMVVGAALSVVDWREHRLPNRTVGLLAVVTLGTGAVGLGLDATRSTLAGAALGSLMFGGPILAANLIAPNAMGFGDVKLGAVLGLWIGWHSPGLGLIALLGAFLLAFPQALGRLVRDRPSAIAFGPYLIAATSIAVAATFALPT